MDANILCTLLAQRIPPEQFQLHGLEVVFFDPEQNNKPVGSPNESPYDTPENRAIVDDVIKNYDALEDVVNGILEWVAAQPGAPQKVVDFNTQSQAAKGKMVK